MLKLSLVVPTLNEEANVVSLVRRIDEVLKDFLHDYEIIFIDDHSRDRTREFIAELGKRYPVKVYLKQGPKGKAQSLIEGFGKARHEILGMIDADLQYPPEALPSMLRQISRNSADVVIARRKIKKTSFLRRVFSDLFRLIFVKTLHGLDFDVQSGMKVFRREVFTRSSLSPTPWTFDMDFLLQAESAGYLIREVPVEFAARKNGQTKISLIKSSWEIGSAAIALKFRDTKPIAYDNSTHTLGSFHYKGNYYLSHTALSPEESALEQLNYWQKRIALVGLFALGMLTAWNWMFVLIGLLSLLIALYFIDLLFNLFLAYRGFFQFGEVRISKYRIESRRDWPRYTILCPLYKEEKIIGQFVRAMKSLDYPKDKLEVLLLLEENDEATIKAAKKADLPEFISIVEVPDSQPKTKPKACNFGLHRATGEYAVIYDAEDIPEIDQLKKSVMAFEKLGNEIGCIQAKLNYYNPKQNLLTKLFTAEYSLWFDLVLPGLQSIHAPIPLGGTSNHFRTQDLRNLGGWDAFNVTEDADLGVRLFKRGLRTAILDSTTYEEANSQLGNWLKQRSRWIKGYFQTYLVHMRNPHTFWHLRDWWHFFTFQLVLGGKVLAILINPLMWVMTIVYFLFRPWVGQFIESLFLAPVFYIGVFTLVIGNFLYAYYYMMGLAKRQLWDLIPFTLLVPVYWLMISWAGAMAAWDLVMRPHHWHKTLHGLHLPQSEPASHNKSELNFNI